MATRSRRFFFVFLLSTGKVTPVDCVQFWALLFKKDVDKLKIAQRKLLRCSQSSWHHLEGEAKKVGLVYSGKEEAELWSSTHLQLSEGQWQSYGAKPFLGSARGINRRNNGCRLQLGRLRWTSGKKIQCALCSTEMACSEGYETFLLRSLQD